MFQRPFNADIITGGKTDIFFLRQINHFRQFLARQRQSQLTHTTFRKSVLRMRVVYNNNPQILAWISSFLPGLHRGRQVILTVIRQINYSNFRVRVHNIFYYYAISNYTLTSLKDECATIYF